MQRYANGSPNHVLSRHCKRKGSGLGYSNANGYIEMFYVERSAVFSQFCIFYAVAGEISSSLKYKYKILCILKFESWAAVDEYIRNFA